MLKERAQLLTSGLLGAELLIWAAAFFAAHKVRAWLPEFWELLPVRAGHSPSPILLFTALLVWVIAAGVFGLRKSYRRQPLGSELWAIAKSGLAVFLGLMTAIALAKLPHSSRIFVVLFALFGTSAIALLRVCIRAALLNTRKLGFNSSRLAIVGDGKLADELAAMVRDHQGWGMSFVGFIAVDPKLELDGKVLGTVDQIENIVDQNVIDDVIFAVDRYRLGDLEEVFQACEETGVRTRVVLNFFPHKFSRPEISELDGLPLLSFHATNNAQLSLFIKRVFDLAVSGATMVLGAPVFLAIALSVKLTSPGPVFFVQRRVGLNGREFGLFKFRSMVEGAEAQLEELQAHNEVDGPVFKIKSDPRVTAVGRLLRKTSLDELPQFWNVWRGEMSVVGPRPPLPHEVAEYERWQRRRLSVKPGITCIWQVSGRSGVDFDEWMRMDMSYIENWSLWLDMKLFVKTIPAVLFGRGAH